MLDLSALADTASSRLAKVADPAKAGPMAAYMKTDMPFYGVQKPQRTAILRDLVASFPPAGDADYEAAVRTLWGLAHREEKYLALGYARHFDEFVIHGSGDGRHVDLHRFLIVDGAWWDLVDETAIHLFGRSLARDRKTATATARRWIGDDDLWLRRTSIICQVGHRGDTDRSLLFDACTATMQEREFFIRKAIGWALREFAKVDAEAVRAFVADRRGEMSGLSYREATKHL